MSNPFWATSRGVSRTLGWVSRLAIIMLAGGLLGTAVIAGIAPYAWRTVNAHSEMPVTLPQWEDLAQRTYVYDRYGAQIAIYELENSQPVSLAQIPSEVIAAVLAVEDRTFFAHHGVNIRSLARAVMSNAEGGSARQGASTITQQVVKIEYLGGLERDGRYKLLQVHYALMLEREKSKNEILERYLNTAFFGNNAYGIQAAAEVYFGKRVEELNMIEGAFLAGLVQAPTSYDPIRRAEASQRRFAESLGALVDTKMITPEQRDQLLAPEGGFELPSSIKSFPERVNVRTHYTEAVKDYLLNRTDILGETRQERYNTLFRGGLRIYTTFDPFIQFADDQAREQTLPNNEAGIQTALVTLDSKTGAVRAMTSGRDFKAGVNEVNLTLSPRQTGSSIKLFILAAAMQAGAQPDDLVDGSTPCRLPNVDDPNQPIFEIRNAVGGGVEPITRHTSRSINCAYARLSQIVGLDRVVDTTYRMADSPYLRDRKNDPNPAKRVMPYASFATGANEMSPLDMAAGAQTIANDGIHHEPYYVERIDSPRGVVYEHNDPGTRVLSPDAAERAIVALEAVVDGGTGRRAALDDGREVAGKTGTQDQNTNAWFVGFTPELTTAVWVGHPDKYLQMTGNDVPEFDGREVQGGLIAAPIWKIAMTGALANTPPSTFRDPPAAARPAVRLFLPGTECIYTTSTRQVAPDPDASTVPPETTPDGSAVSTEPTAAPVVTVLVPVSDANTTIARGNVDPFAPLPTVPKGAFLSSCGRGGTVVPSATTTTTTAPGG